MNDQKQIDVGSLLGAISSSLGENESSLNAIDARPGGGTHGTRLAQAFQAAAQAASGADTSDAGQQLALAAQVMKQQGQGKAAGYYASGLEQAAQHFQGRNGLTASDLPALLGSLTKGVQQANPARPGQGTMLDALLPAVTSFLGARQQGVDPTQAAIQAMSSAANGAMGTMMQGHGNAAQDPFLGGQGHMDPGAASATSILGGIFQAILPGIMGAMTQGMGGGLANSQGQAQPQDEQAAGGLGGLLGGLFGEMTGGQAAGGAADPTAQDSAGGLLGGLLGGLGGGQASGRADTASQDSAASQETQGRKWGTPTDQTDGSSGSGA